MINKYLVSKLILRIEPNKRWRNPDNVVTDLAVFLKKKRKVSVVEIDTSPSRKDLKVITINPTYTDMLDTLRGDN